MAIKPFKIAFAPVKSLGEPIMGQALEVTIPGIMVEGYANESNGLITSIVIDCKVLGNMPVPAQGATFNSTDKTVTVTFGA